jgi:hypothetical protein
MIFLYPGFDIKISREKGFQGDRRAVLFDPHQVHVGQVEILIGLQGVHIKRKFQILYSFQFPVRRLLQKIINPPVRFFYFGLGNT